LLSIKQKSDFFKTCILCKDLLPEAYLLLASDFVAESLKKKSEIISYQEKSDYFYLIYSGVVKISRQINSKEIVYRLLTTGDCFGDLSVLCANHNLFTKYAVTDLILLRVDCKAFLIRTKEYPQLLFNLIYKYSLEINHLADLVSLYDRSSAKEKFVFLLTELYRLTGYRQNDKILIENCLTQQEMAGFCGMERTTLFREIKKMEKCGWLVQEKHKWQISGELLKSLNLKY